MKKPPVPDDLDLRDFRFMPLDVVQMAGSETWAMADGWAAKALINLWMRSWHQVPAGSLPTNDALLRTWSGVPNWDEVRDIALRGFEEFDDGKLYHKIICEKALEAWGRKQKFKKAGKAGAKAQWGNKKRAKGNAKGNAKSEWNGDAKGDALARQGQGQGQGQGKEERETEFEHWWPVVPRKAGKGQARKAYAKARQSTSAAVLLKGVQRYAAEMAGSDTKFIKHPATWLNGECWLDESAMRQYEKPADDPDWRPQPFPDVGETYQPTDEEIKELDRITGHGGD